MKTANDTKTPDLLGEGYDLAGARPAQQSKAALRSIRFRETHGVQAMTVNIPVDVLAAFQKYCADKGRKKSEVIAHLIKSQLLRKR